MRKLYYSHKMGGTGARMYLENCSRVWYTSKDNGLLQGGDAGGHFAGVRKIL